MLLGGSVDPPIDPHHLLLGGMNAAGEDPRLHRRLVVGRPDQPIARHATRQGGNQPSPWIVAAGEADKGDASAERRRVVGGIARTAGKNLGRVVLEDQNRRLARHASHAAVHELVGQQIAQDDDAQPRKAIDEREETAVAGCRGGWHRIETA